MPAKMSFLKTPEKAYQNLKGIVIVFAVVNLMVAILHGLGAPADLIYQVAAFSLVMGLWVCFL